MAIGRDFEVAGIASARCRVPNGGWLVVPLSVLSAQGKVTDDAPGRDVAFIEIEITDNTPTFFVTFDAKAAGTGDPEANSVVAFPKSNPDTDTQTNVETTAIRIAAGGSYTLEKVRNITHISLWASAAHHSEIQITLHSYKTAIESPWS